MTLQNGDPFITSDRWQIFSSAVINIGGGGATAYMFTAPCDLDIVEAYYVPLTAGTGAASTTTLQIGTSYTTPGVAGGAADTNYFAEYCSIPAGASIVLADQYRFGLIKRRILKGHIVTITYTTLTDGGTGYITMLAGIPRVE